MERQILYQRRPQIPARCAVHASPCRHAIQPRSEGQIPGPARRRKARKTTIVAIRRKLIETANALVKADHIGAEKAA